MNELIGRVFNFEKRIFPDSAELYGTLARDGQSPQALMISCADSRIVPEEIMQARPGDLFVCRNAGNIVPPYASMLGGVSATVEYAVAALGVRDIIVCGHSDCGAMKAVAYPDGLEAMPNVAAWLKHSMTAEHVVSSCKPGLEGTDRIKAISLENVIAQLHNLRTHPSVARAAASGEMSLHGWFVDIHAGHVLGYDGEKDDWTVLSDHQPLPVAFPAKTRYAMAEAAE